MMISLFESELEDIDGIKYIQCLEDMRETIRRVMCDSPSVKIVRTCRNTQCSNESIKIFKPFIEINIDMLCGNITNLENLISNSLTVLTSHPYCEECQNKESVLIEPQLQLFLQVSRNTFLRLLIRFSAKSKFCKFTVFTDV